MIKSELRFVGFVFLYMTYQEADYSESSSVRRMQWETKIKSSLYCWQSANALPSKSTAVPA